MLNRALWVTCFLFVIADVWHSIMATQGHPKMLRNIKLRLLKGAKVYYLEIRMARLYFFNGFELLLKLDYECPHKILKTLFNALVLTNHFWSRKINGCTITLRVISISTAAHDTCNAYFILTYVFHFLDLYHFYIHLSENKVGTIIDLQSNLF